jgi:hypothetical protein
VRRTDHSSRGVLPSVVCLPECDRESSTMRRPRPTGVSCAVVKKCLTEFEVAAVNSANLRIFVVYNITLYILNL